MIVLFCLDGSTRGLLLLQSHVGGRRGRAVALDVLMDVMAVVMAIDGFGRLGGGAFLFEGSIGGRYPALRLR